MHKHLINGRAPQAQEYPDELCRAIVRGLMDQMVLDNRLAEGEIGATYSDIRDSKGRFMREIRAT